MRENVRIAILPVEAAPDLRAVLQPTTSNRFLRMSNSIIDFSHLTPAERIELAEQLWDSLEPRDRAEMARADEQTAELRRRRAALDEDGDPGEPWEAVLDQIEARDR